MGKTSNAYIDRISKEIDSINDHVEKFGALKTQWIKFSDGHIKLVDARTDITLNRYHGDEKKALADPDYTALGQKLDALLPIGEKMEKTLDSHIAAISGAVKQSNSQLDAFEAYVAKKEKGKLPWKKKSVSSSKEYIKGVRAALDSFTIPRIGS